MDEIKVDKVKSTSTGLYKTSTGGWSTRGKTWNSMGHLKNSLKCEGYWGRGSNQEDICPPDDIIIIEVIIRETEANIKPLIDIVERERRLLALTKEFGESFSTLVKRIEDQNQTDKFQWVLTAKGKWNYANNVMAGAFTEMLDLVKSFKLKQNVDYKKTSNCYTGGAIAFASKADAVKVRLAMAGECHSIDIKNHIKTNLDNLS